MLLFLCHSRTDVAFANQLNASLLGAGIRTFLDQKDILVGESIPERLYAGIDASTHLIFIISEKSVESRWVAEELSIAKMKEKQEKRIQVVPVVIDQIQIPTSVVHLRYADFRKWRNPDAYREAFLELLRGLGVKPKLLGSEDLLWYSDHSNAIRRIYLDLHDIRGEIRGSLTAAFSTTRSQAAECLWRLALKYAFSDPGRTLDDLRELCTLIGDHTRDGSRLGSLKLAVEKAIGCGTSLKTEYWSRDGHDDDLADQFQMQLWLILRMLEDLRAEVETVALAAFSRPGNDEA